MDRVLVVEDDRELAAMLRTILSGKYKVGLAEDGGSALKLLQAWQPHLVLLDIVLPDKHGVDVCRVLRGLSDVPILILSGLTDSGTKVAALEAGADGYLSKPFAWPELLALMQALLRRGRANRSGHRAYCDDSIAIDLEEKRVYHKGHPIDLTPTEYRLLACLLEHPGELLSPQELLAHAWGDGYKEAVPCLYTYVHYLRHKVEPNPLRPRYILSRKGLGYLFQPQGQSA
ncbi:MAG: response regulator transcription factor [Anaerolineae bacterium]